MFIANGYLKFREEDVWEDGCQPDTAETSFETEVFKGSTLEGLINKLRTEFEIESKEDVLLDSCGDKGRLDIQRMEDCDGNIASLRQIDRWKRGNQQLWACTYIFNIEETSPADFSGLEGYIRD